jgi:hypothetical protein
VQASLLYITEKVLVQRGEQREVEGEQREREREQRERERERGVEGKQTYLVLSACGRL